MKEENKAVVESNPNANAVSVVVDNGIAGDITMDDCERARIILTQGMSDLVKEGKILPGKLVNSTDEAIIGEVGKPLELIPVDFVKFWVESDADTRDFIKKYPGSSEKELSWEYQDGPRTIKRTFVISYLFVRPQDIAEGFPMPFQFDFRSTNLKAAKRLNTILLKMSSQGKASWANVFTLTPKAESNGKDTYFVTEVNVSRETTQAEADEVKGLRAQFRALKDKILSESEGPTAEPQTAATGEVHTKTKRAEF